MNYSVAIRTLGTAGKKFKRELESLHRQTILPEKIVIYIAEGYSRPEFQVGREEYVWVKKGMVAQRALPYTEIDSDCLLLLDDDVELAPNSMEQMLNAMIKNGADCVGADTFKNQEMSVKGKVFAALTNWVLPHIDQKWAFKIHRHGAFSYLNNPVKEFYWSQSCAGPCSLWKMDAFRDVHLEDELWLDKLGFAFGDDAIEFYKLHKNGYRLGILYDSGVVNLDAKSASGVYQRNLNKFYTRSKGSFLVWWRCSFACETSIWKKVYTAIIYALKSIWLLLLNLVATISVRDIRVPYYYMRGICSALCYVNSREAKKLPSYIIDKK